MASMPKIEANVNHDAATAALLAIRDLADQTGGGLTSVDRLAKIAGLAREALAAAEVRGKRQHAICLDDAWTGAPEAVDAMKQQMAAAHATVCCVCGEPSNCAVCDSREGERMELVNGDCWRQFEIAGPKLFFCDQHKRPALRFMLDGSIEAVSDNDCYVVAVARPGEIDLEIGTLKVRAEEAGGLAAFSGTEILVDGKPLRVRSIEIRGSIDELWTAKMEYLP